MYFIAVSVRPKKNQLKTYTLQCSRLLLRCQEGLLQSVHPKGSLEVPQGLLDPEKV